MKFLSKSLLAMLMFLLIVSVPLKAADGYHNYQELTQAIKNLVAKNVQVAKLQSMGKTLQGRDLWVIQISGTKGGAPESKQALLVVGNLEGDHLIGSEVTLGITEYLINGYGRDEQVTEMLDKRTFYIVPRLNPDGAEAFFAAIKEERAANFKPRDDDYDWKVDEDGPDDLNGDGLITQMRVKDREGDWIVDDNDPRLMKRKESDTPLDQLYAIYSEGLDDDGDGQYNEDGPGGFNIDRNFPHNFGYNPRGIGVYAASEVETTALLDFVFRYNPDFKGQPHRNICGVLVFSKFDNLAAGTGIESGTPTFPEPPRAAQAPGGGMMAMFRGGGRRGAPVAEEPPPTDPQPKRTESRDASLFSEVSEQYKAITGIRSAVSAQPFGSLLEWGYFQYGVPSFSANLWSLRQEAAERPQMKQQAPAAQRGVQSGQAQTADRSAMTQRFAGMRSAGGASPSASTGYDEQWLKWIDDQNEGKGFVAWTKVNHKQLGEVEIGGFEPYLRVNPPAGQIPELSQNHAKFALYLASQFAEITMDEPAVEKLGSNLFKLTVKVRNTGEFPYVTAMGTRTRNITPIVLQLKFDDDKAMEFFGGTNRTDISNLEPGAETEYSWTIISPPGKGIEISLWARNGGGTMKKKVVLK
jgi:hypothetical protein